MPLYEFACLSCEYRFEELSSYNEDSPICPKCGKETKRLVSGFSGVVKGSSNKSIDCIVGESAEKRWSTIEKRKEMRKNKIGDK